MFHDHDRSSWEGNGARPLSWIAWYPISGDAAQQKHSSDIPIIIQTRQPCPVVLLSHGTGGAAMGLAWLAERLVRHGFIAIAVNHHGNTAIEPYRAEGFLCLWERARDLTVVLDQLLENEQFADCINRKEIFLGGFSAGAYTALQLIGAITKHSQYQLASPIPGATRGPREFPDLVDQLPHLLANNAVFQTSWARMSRDYRDARFKAALVCAPGRSVLGFDEQSLGRIDRPAHIVVGRADAVAPLNDCAVWLKNRIQSSTLEILTPDVGHYIFLPEATDADRLAAPEVYVDAPGVNRSIIHDQIANAAAALFGR